MRIKNAFRILAGDAGVIYKSVFFRLIVVSIMGIAGYFLVAKGIFSTIEANKLGESFIALLQHPFNWEGVIDNFIESFEGFLMMLSTKYMEIIFAVIILFVLNIFKRMGNYVVADLYNGFMSAQTKFSFTSKFFASFLKAFVYAIIIVPIVFVYDGLVLLISGVIVYFAIPHIYVFAVIIALIFMILAFSLKFTLFSEVLPEIFTENKGIGCALKSIFRRRKDFVTLLGNYAFAIMLTFYLNVSVGVFTVGVGLFVSLPLTANFSILISLVHHYNEKGKKFYVDDSTVVVPRQLDKNADLLKYM